jgi:hypothetical protein
MASIIVKMLEIQNQVKIYHFQTGSYARHMASDRLFSSLITNIDRFGEVFQNSKRIRLNKGSKIVVRNLTDKQMYKYLSDFAEWLSVELPRLISGSRKDGVDLLNIRDEILADVNQTLYLFSFE